MITKNTSITRTLLLLAQELHGCHRSANMIRQRDSCRGRTPFTHHGSAQVEHNPRPRSRAWHAREIDHIAVEKHIMHNIQVIW